MGRRDGHRRRLRRPGHRGPGQLSTKSPEELVGDAADELYGLPPEDFTAARDEKVLAARDAGDRPLAAAIGRLRKPTVSAWVLNLLVREQPEVGDQLIELGADLRQAQETLSGPALKELTAQRGKLVAALVRSARRITAREGHQVTQSTSFELEQTLHAALADPVVATQVAAGRLVRATSRTGLESALGEPAPEPEPARPRLRVVRDPAEPKEDPKLARERRRREEERARLREEWQAAERTRAEAEEDVEDLEGRLEDAEDTEREAGRREREARRERDAAVRKRDSAARRVADLAARLDDLPDD